MPFISRAWSPPGEEDLDGTPALAASSISLKFEGWGTYSDI